MSKNVKITVDTCGVGEKHPAPSNVALLLRDVFDGEFMEMAPYAVKTHRSLLYSQSAKHERSSVNKGDRALVVMTIVVDVRLPNQTGLV